MAKAARKRTIRHDPSLDDIFRSPTERRTELPKRRPYAVRQIRGPEDHPDLMIMATDGPDAHRQYFNYFGLNEQTHRYTLRVVEIDRNHPLAEKAITCDTPRSGDLTLVERFEQTYQDIERDIKTGAAMAEVESM